MDPDDGSPRLPAFGSRSAVVPPPPHQLAGFASSLADAGGPHSGHHHRHLTATSADHPLLLSMPSYDYANGSGAAVNSLVAEPRFAMSGAGAASYADQPQSRHHHQQQHQFPDGANESETEAAVRSAANSGDLLSDRGDPAADSDAASRRAKILTHPFFPRLVQVYVNCRKIGAPPEVVALLEEAGELRHIHSFRPPHQPIAAVGDDPELDDFMGSYAEKLQGHHDELTESLEEARSFLKRMEAQLHSLSGGWAVGSAGSGGGGAGGGPVSDAGRSSAAAGAMSET